MAQETIGETDSNRITDELIKNPLTEVYDVEDNIERKELLISDKEYYNQVVDGSKVGAVAVNVSNAIIGAGIIGLPFALKEAGFILGLGLLFAMCCISRFSLGVLIEAGITLRCRSYENLASSALGIGGEKAVLAAQFAFDFGAGLSYLIIAADTSTEVMELIVGKNVTGLREMCIAVISVCFMFPLVTMRDISKLEAYSGVSVFTVFVVMVMVFVKMGVKLSTCGDDCGSVSYFTSSFTQLMESIGIFSFSFVCHDCIFLYYNSLHEGTSSRFGKMATYALSGSSLLTALLGSAGYLTFRNDTQSNLLNNYEDGDILATIMRVLYVISMILTFPICFFVCRQVLHSLLTERTKEGDLPDVRTVTTTRHMSYTLFIFILSVFIVMLTSNLGVVMSITGNVAGSSLGYILPALIALSSKVKTAQKYNHNDGGKANTSNVLLYLLLFFGIITFVLGIVTELW